MSGGKSSEREEREKEMLRSTICIAIEMLEQCIGELVVAREGLKEGKVTAARARLAQTGETLETLIKLFLTYDMIRRRLIEE